MWGNDQQMYRPYGQQYGQPPQVTQRPGYNGYNLMYGQAPQPQMQPPSNLQWVRVSGVQGAREVSVPPGGEVWIMDENRPVFYHKTADQIGQVSTHAYQFNEISLDSDAQQPSIDMSKLATRDELKAIYDRLDRYEKNIANIGGAMHEQSTD